LTSDNRYTFSQVVSLLIELESTIAKFYAASAERARRRDLREIFLTFEKANLKRRESLSRVRQGTVIEMSLEPITGLQLEKYELKAKHAMEDGNLDDLQKAIALESITQDLCRGVSDKVANVSADTSELLSRFSQESLERKHILLSVT